MDPLRDGIAGASRSGNGTGGRQLRCLLQAVGTLGTLHYMAGLGGHSGHSG